MIRVLSFGRDAARLVLAMLASLPMVGHSLEAVTDRQSMLVWLTNGVGSSRSSATDSAASYSSDSEERTVGVGYSISDNFNVALSHGRGQSDVDVSGQENDDARSVSWQGAMIWTQGSWSVRGSFSSRKHETDRSRIEILPIRETSRRVVLDARVHAREQIIEFGVSRTFDLADALWLRPGVGVSHVRIQTDDFVEQAGARNVFEVSTGNEHSSYALATLGMGRTVFAGDWAFLPHGEVGLEYRLDQKTQGATATLVGTRYGFNSEGLNTARSRVSATAGVAMHHWRGYGADLHVTHDRQSGFRSTWYGLDLEYSF